MTCNPLSPLEFMESLEIWKFLKFLDILTTINKFWRPIHMKSPCRSLLGFTLLSNIQAISLIPVSSNFLTILIRKNPRIFNLRIYLRSIALYSPQFLTDLKNERNKKIGYFLKYCIASGLRLQGKPLRNLTSIETYNVEGLQAKNNQKSSWLTDLQPHGNVYVILLNNILSCLSKTSP